MKFLKYLNEEYVAGVPYLKAPTETGYIKYVFPIYKNPSTSEIKTLRKDTITMWPNLYKNKNPYARFILQPNRKNIYVFDAEVLHIQALSALHLSSQDFVQLGSSEITSSGKLIMGDLDWWIKQDTWEYIKNYFIKG